MTTLARYCMKSSPTTVFNPHLFQVSLQRKLGHTPATALRMKGQMPTPDTMSKESFKEYLGRYEEVARSLSDSKPPKPGARTLLELDDFRYNEAVNAFSSPKPKRQMDHDDVKTLVEWKLRHGKFRPTLMNLVSSNDSAKVASTIKDAMAAYWKTKDAATALTAISALKGIGPATAALLLSVHDPDDVIFFSDEAFWWLCCGGQKGPIKYNSKEYKQLSDAARELKDGIGASAMEIEKVAYVLFKGDNVDVQAPSKKTAGGKVPESISKRPMTKPEPEEDTTRTKRKPTKEVEESSAGLRRSKRGKA